MAKSGRMGGDPNSRMSNAMSGVERSHRGGASYRAHSTVRNESYLNNPTLGTSGPFKTRTLTVASGKGGLPKPTGEETVAQVKAKNIPRTYVPVPNILTKKFVTKKPAAVVKPVAKKLATVVTNVTNEKLSPAKQAMARAKPPATRFGVVTGKTTGTRVSGGGGYGGGGTRGGGSLSGQGSGSRSAGTSRTGGTQRNDPVRG